MKITAEPRSDQWNADDFVGGPRTFTIAGVKPGTAEQKYDIELVEGQGRSWRPPLTMLRLLIAAWGDDASHWIGRRVTLYRDASVRFGPDAVGGIRVSHMSDLPGGKPFKVPLTSSRGKRTLHAVEPLADAPQQAARPEPTAEEVADATDVDQLRAMYRHAGPERQEQIKARVAELTTPAPEPVPAPAADDGDYEEPPASFFDEQGGA